MASALLSLLVADNAAICQGIEDITWRTSYGSASGYPAPGSNVVDGKIVVLSFWSIHCAPCLSQLKKINRLAELFEEDSIVFLWLNTHDEPEASIDSVMLEYKNIVFAFDSAQTTWKTFREPPWGRVLVYNKHGQVVWTGTSHEIDKTLLEMSTSTDEVLVRKRYYANLSIESVVLPTESLWTVEQSDEGLLIVLQNMFASDLVTKLYKFSYGSDDIIECVNVPETLKMYNVRVRLSNKKLNSVSLKQALSQLTAFFNIGITVNKGQGSSNVKFEFSSYRDLSE